MNANTGLTKVLAVTGTALVSFPLLAPMLLSLGYLIASGGAWRFDYLMPAELFLLALGGGGLLIWAAWRGQAHRAQIAGSLAAAVILLFGSQGLAVMTGLAHGDTPPEGWRFTLVLTLLIGYVVSLIALLIGGMLLIRDLWQEPQQPKVA